MKLCGVVNCWCWYAGIQTPRDESPVTLGAGEEGDDRGFRVFVGSECEFSGRGRREKEKVRAKVRVGAVRSRSEEKEKMAT